MMKKSWLYILLSMFMLSSCNMYKEVELKEVLDLQVLEFGDTGADCEIYVSVYNPNNYKITLLESHVDLTFEGSSLGSVELLDKVVIPKNSLTTVKLKCLASYESVQAILGNVFTLLFKNEYTMEGNGYIKARALLFSKKVPMEFKENLSRRDIGF